MLQIAKSSLFNMHKKYNRFLWWKYSSVIGSFFFLFGMRMAVWLVVVSACDVIVVMSYCYTFI